MVETQPDITPPAPRVRQPRTVPALAPRFALAAISGAAVVHALSSGVLGSSAPVAAAVTALYFCAGVVVAAFMRVSYPHAAIGICNLVTLARLILTVSLVAPILGNAPAPVWAVFALAVLALALDGLDGWFARRQGLASAFGARFDMEVDAGLSLILALNALVSGSAGPLVVILGLPRYAFAVAGLVLPWLARPLPDRFGRKVACVVQMSALIALQTPILPQMLSALAVIAAVVALSVSFGRDIRWLYRKRA
jgi:phosphatidylglycerophosphate synthase